MCKNKPFSKFKDEKRTFQNSWTKIEFHAMFKDENNNLTFSQTKAIVKDGKCDAN